MVFSSHLKRLFELGMSITWMLIFLVDRLLGFRRSIQAPPFLVHTAGCSQEGGTNRKGVGSGIPGGSPKYL
jgi:hypothetical protein